MTEDELKKLRSCYHSFLELQRVLENTGVLYLSESAFRPIADAIYFSGCSDTLPPFNESVFKEPLSIGYSRLGLLSYVALAVGKLRAAIDTPENTPVMEGREFPFVKSTELRKIIERDYIEIQRACITSCWKSVIILSGSAIETILLDLLLQHEPAAKTAAKAPKSKNKTDLQEWDLSDLINVSVELRLVSPGVEKLSHSVRQYRNLVHPGNEISKGLWVDAEEARIALQVVNMVHRELSS